MRKILCAMMALLLGLGAIGCVTAEPEPTAAEPSIAIVEQPTDPPVRLTVDPGLLTTAEPTAEPEPTDESTEAVYLFSFADNRGTAWMRSIDTRTYPYHTDEQLMIDRTGEAILTHDDVRYRVTENGETWLLEKDLYASPEDSKPTLTLNAGEVRLLEVGAALRIQVLSDPLGVFAGFSPEDLTLSQAQYYGSEWESDAPCDFGTAPHFQQGTTWLERAMHRMGSGTLVGYSNCTLKAEADGTVRGTVRETYEATAWDCAMLWASDAAALVDADGELLFYGGYLQRSEDDAHDNCAEFALKANYDPFELSVGNALILYKLVYYLEPENILGRNRYQLIAEFVADGWTHEPLSMHWGEETDYAERFVKLTKDGRMLLVYLEWEVGRFGVEWYALAYVLIGADGSLESWGGQRPGDHALADAYRIGDAFPFPSTGLGGLAEDDAVLLLDDGRVLVTYSGHFEGGVEDFIVFDPRE